ncbi:histone deacetylase HDT1 [Cajanus cajan]|uniref:histone deacetylase HDT1 n=1 Tax=Cajanus cajan TaxID=3821 RepID=UPI00098DB907|nr:histone deacetylase HDT1 [Cajanus cajan]
MDAPMQFWGVEVKVGQTVKIDPMDPESSYIHISQVALGEAKKDKASEPVVLFVKVGAQKIVLGTLNRNDIPHLSLDLVLDSDFELSHNSKSASVHFCGYKVLTDSDNVSDFSDSDDDLPVEGLENGIFAIKPEGAKVTKPSKPVPLTGASAKQVKTVDPKKVEEDDSDDDDDSDDEEANEDELNSSDEMDDDSDSDEESESDEADEETPEKKGKKRAKESASKTPVSAKKAKNATPEKTDGKKSVHVATPYPSKKGGKSPNSNAKGKTPNNNAKGNTPNSNAKGKNPNSAGGKKPQFRK